MILDPYKDDMDDYDHYVTTPRREEREQDLVKRVCLCSKCGEPTSFADTGDDCVITCNNFEHEMNKPDSFACMSELKRYRALKRQRRK